MKVTAKMLERKQACPGQVEVFKAEWPEGVIVTEEALLRAVELGLDLEWFALHWLSASIEAEYKRQRAAIDAEYKRQRAPIYAEYKRQIAAILFAAITSMEKA